MDDAAGAVHELVRDVDVEAKHDANSHCYLEQAFQSSRVLWLGPCKFRLQRCACLYADVDGRAFV